jgi:hypothetical protein
VVDQQLAAALKQIEQAGFPPRPCELVRFLELDHGQATALGIDAIALFSQLFFIGQQCFAFRQPGVSRHDGRMGKSGGRQGNFSLGV